MFIHFLLYSFNLEYKERLNKVVVYLIFTKNRDNIVLHINFVIFKDFYRMFSAKCKYECLITTRNISPS